MVAPLRGGGEDRFAEEGGRLRVQLRWQRDAGQVRVRVRARVGGGFVEEGPVRGRGVVVG